MSAEIRIVGNWPDSSPEEVVYPESNGMRLAENIEQFNWIVLLVENFKALFADDPDVFVAGDLECQRAEQEHLRAQRMAAKLRELGINPDE